MMIWNGLLVKCRSYEGFYFRQLKAIVSAIIEYERQASQVVG